MQNLELHIGSLIQWVSLDMLRIFVQQARTKGRSISSSGNLPFGGSHPPRLLRGKKCLPCDSLLIPVQLGVSLKTSCIKEIQRNVCKSFSFFCNSSKILHKFQNRISWQPLTAKNIKFFSYRKKKVPLDVHIFHHLDIIKPKGKTSNSLFVLPALICLLFPLCYA